MGKKKAANAGARHGQSLLEGRVFFTCHKREILAWRNYAQGLELLGARVADELDESVTDFVTCSGKLSKVFQNRVNRVVDAGATIQVLGQDEVRDVVTPPTPLVKELLLGSDGDRSMLSEIFAAYYQDMPKVAVSKLDLSGLTWRGSVLEHVNFHEVNFAKADLPKADLKAPARCRFNDASLEDAMIHDPTDCSFHRTNLRRAEIRGSCAGSSFQGADLRDATLILKDDPDRSEDAPDFSTARLDGCEVLSIDSRGADFSACSAVNSEWFDVDAPGILLCNADLSGANLEDTDFSGGNLTGANFQGARLTQVDLTGADLTGADFTGALLVDTTLDPDLDLDSIKGLGSTLLGAQGSGPCLNALNQAVVAAHRMEINFRVHRSSEPKPMIVSFKAYQRPFHFEVVNEVTDANGTHDLGLTMDLAEGFRRAATSCAGAEVRFESVMVKTSKSPTPGPRVRELCIAALEESFGQAAPGAAELKALTKAFRAELKSEAAAKKP